ncbi:MAG: RnfABCDGE type electron transport complex subunit D [Planctomycetota bacterium]
MDPTDTARAAWRKVRDLAFAEPEAEAPAAHRPDGRELRRYMLGTLMVCVPLLAAAAAWLGPRVLLVFAFAFAVGRAIELAMARFRDRPVRGGALTFAALLALVVPPHLPLWLVAATAGFGIFFGREVFGGTGHHVFNPVLAGKAFLVVSYPTIAVGGSVGSLPGEGPANLFGHALPAGAGWAGLVLLAGSAAIAARAVDWRVPVSVLGAAVCAGLVLGGFGAGALPQRSFMLEGGLLFGALLLAGDPAASPGTRPGRWAYGGLVGLLAAVICAFSGHRDFAMYAILLGNIAAPSIDVAVLTVRGTGEIE